MARVSVSQSHWILRLPGLNPSLFNGDPAQYIIVQRLLEHWATFPRQFMMRRTQFVSILASLGAGLCYAAPAFAYLDPGTGSIILQGLIASIAGLLVAGRLYWQRIKQFFAGLMSGGKNESSDGAGTEGRMDPDAHETTKTDDVK